MPVRPRRRTGIRGARTAFALVVALIGCRIDYDLLSLAPVGSDGGAHSHAAGLAGWSEAGSGKAASGGSGNGAHAAAAGAAGAAGHFDAGADSGGASVTGGASAQGGTTTGSNTQGGDAGTGGDSAGAQAGTTSADGGVAGAGATGGSATGGSATGGSATGGGATGGTGEAGSAAAAGSSSAGAGGQAGAETGGSPTGGAGSGGAGGVGLGDGTLVTFGERNGTDFSGVTDFTTLTEVEPDNPFAEMAQIWVSGTAGNFASNQVGLLRFDVSGLGSSVTVTGAELRLTTRNTEPMLSGSITVHRVLESWVYMEATWNNRWTAPAAQPWTVLGCGVGSRDSTVLATFSPRDKDTEYVIPLPASVVQGWVSDAATNHGFALVASAGADDALFQGTLTGTPQAARPLLSVTYQP